MKQELEREVKLAPEAGFVLPELGGEPMPTRRFTSTYHDTADLVLARHNVTLRHRVEAGTGVWQLKLPRGSARIELEQPGPPAHPPLELASLLVGFLRGRELGPVARLRTRRESVRADGAEIVDDSVAVLAGARVVQRFRELEVELLTGDEKTLRRLEKELRRAGASSADLRPKLYRALQLDVPSDAPAPEDDAPPSRVLGLALAEQARRLLLHDPGTRLGSDTEDLHQMRVATRRLRAFLKVGKPLLEPSWSEPLREELAWLGRALGPARDLDVLVEHIAAEIDALGEDGRSARGVLEALEAERASARGVVVEALSSDRYLGLLDRLEHVGSPELTGLETPLRELWQTAWKRARKALSRLDGSSVGRGDPSRAHSPQAFPLRGRARGSRARKARHSVRERRGQAPGRPRRESGRRRRRGAAPRLRRDGWGRGRRRAPAPARAGPQGGRPGAPSCRLEEAAPHGEEARVSTVRAAGGVPVRAASGGLEVLVVHRPAYGDWTFPKGKCEQDESDEGCALREVEEETGLRCELEAELPSTRYRDARGRAKQVRYWRLRVVGGEPTFDHEVDEARWVSPAEAESLLTYERDLEVLRALG